MNGWSTLHADWKGAAHEVRTRNGVIASSPPFVNEQLKAHVAERALCQALKLPAPMCGVNDLIPSRFGPIAVCATEFRPWFLGVPEEWLTGEARVFALIFCPSYSSLCYLVGYATKREVMDNGRVTDRIWDPLHGRQAVGKLRGRHLVKPGRVVPVVQLHEGAVLLKLAQGEPVWSL